MEITIVSHCPDKGQYFPVFVFANPSSPVHNNHYTWYALYRAFPENWHEFIKTLGRHNGISSDHFSTPIGVPTQQNF